MEIINPLVVFYLLLQLLAVKPQQYAYELPTEGDGDTAVYAPVMESFLFGRERRRDSRPRSPKQYARRRSSQHRGFGQSSFVPIDDTHHVDVFDSFAPNMGGMVNLFHRRRRKK